jgi:hypothetical protein
MAREISDRDLLDLGDDRFEQLIASLVFAQYPNAERPGVPDAGADVFVPATGGRGVLVWQAKLYAGSINWNKCEQSLDAAVAAYSPEAVTFVFPRNLTAPRRATFEQRLVARHPEVEVTHWGLHRIQELLARYPDIATRYFGEDRSEVLPGLIRAMAQGGKPLENTLNIADRAFELDAFADVTDPSFEYEMSFGRADAAPTVWSDVPFMVIEEVRDGRRFRTEARLRPEAKGEAQAGFTDDDAGERSRHRARESFAAGESVEVTEGVWLQVDPAPVAATEAYKGVKERGATRALAKLSPGEQHKFEMRLELADGTVTRRFTTRPLPPKPGANLAYGSAEDGVALFLDFTLSEPPVVSMDFQLRYRPTESAAVNAAAARFVLDFYRAGRVTCLAPDYLPDEGITMDAGSKPIATDDALGFLELSAVLYDAVATIEEQFGPLTVPEHVARSDLEAAVAAASIIRTGAGTMSFEMLAIEVPNDQVNRVIDGAQTGHPGQHPVQLTVFGRELDLGLGEFTTPPVQYVTTEQGSTPGTTLLRLRTEKTQLPFRLVRETSKRAPKSEKLWTPDKGPSGLLQTFR